jgi:predicted anti-sigma-YlaC factor YlaD
MDTPISLPSEKFELLSAYLDGEVSPEERKQVEAWLASDPEFQQTYQQMLTLQGSLRSMPVAIPSMPTEQLVSQVMGRLDRKPKRWVWGGIGAAAAAATILIGAMSGLFTGNQTGTLRMAQQPKPQPALTDLPQPMVPTIAMRTSESVNPKALMIVLERPPVAIPVVPDSTKVRQLDDDAISNF